MLQLLYAQQRKNTRKRKTQKRQFSYCYSLIGSLYARVQYASLTYCVQNFQTACTILKVLLYTYIKRRSRVHTILQPAIILSYASAHASKSSRTPQEAPRSSLFFYFFGLSAFPSPPERNTSSVSTSIDQTVLPIKRKIE